MHLLVFLPLFPDFLNIFLFQFLLQVSIKIIHPTQFRRSLVFVRMHTTSLTMPKCYHPDHQYICHGCSTHSRPMLLRTKLRDTSKAFSLVPPLPDRLPIATSCILVGCEFQWNAQGRNSDRAVAGTAQCRKMFSMTQLSVGSMNQAPYQPTTSSKIKTLRFCASFWVWAHWWTQTGRLTLLKPFATMNWDARPCL
jgi:hypothetical protein